MFTDPSRDFVPRPPDLTMYSVCWTYQGLRPPHPLHWHHLLSPLKSIHKNSLSKRILQPVQTVLNEWYLIENRYKPFYDKKVSNTWMKRGSNHESERYLNENASPIRISQLRFQPAEDPANRGSSHPRSLAPACWGTSNLMNSQQTIQPAEHHGPH